MATPDAVHDGSRRGPSLAAIAGAARSGRLSATALVTEALSRIDALDAGLNAVVSVSAERALERARRLDTSGDRNLPLFGLPMLVKDNQQVAGWPTSYGSWTTADAPPASTTDAGPDRLEQAGAIVVGKTNLSEFASEAYAANPRFGATATPWSPEWNAGGSSGGSAAALAAGMCAIATGTDGGGSVRIPATFCGLLGLKPTRGLIGRRPIPAWMDLSSDGVLAHGADDLALLLDVLARPEPGDVRYPGDRFQDRERPLRGTVRRIVSLTSMTPGARLDPLVAAAFERALKRLSDVVNTAVEEAASATVEALATVNHDWFLRSSTEQAWALGAEALAAGAATMDPVVRGYLQHGIATTTPAYLSARRRGFAQAATVDRLVGDGTVVATPLVTVSGIHRDGTLPGRTRPGTHVSMFNTMLANVTGHPAITLPAGVLPTGVPFGLQVIAAHGDDWRLIELARHWERACPWPAVAPGYRPFGSDLLRAAATAPVT